MDALSLYIKDAKTRKQIMNGCHIGLAGNHEGRHRTLAKIAQKYFWPEISKDVRSWVSYLSCHLNRVFFCLTPDPRELTIFFVESCFVKLVGNAFWYAYSDSPTLAECSSAILNHVSSIHINLQSFEATRFAISR